MERKDSSCVGILSDQGEAGTASNLSEYTIQQFRFIVNDKYFDDIIKILEFFPILGMFGHALCSCLLLHSKHQNLIGTPSKSFDFHSSDMHWFKNSHPV